MTYESNISPLQQALSRIYNCSSVKSNLFKTSIDPKIEFNGFRISCEKEDIKLFYEFFASSIYNITFERQKMSLVLALSINVEAAQRINAQP